MGLLLYVAVLWLGATAALLRYGDALLTLALRRLAGPLLGAQVAVRWSLRRGALELHHVALGAAALPALEPLLGLPLTLETLELQRLVLAFPLLERLLARARGRPAGPDEPPLRALVDLAGLRVGLRLHAAERWMWLREENVPRCREAVKQAAAARIARADAWTAAVAQKLRALAALRAEASTKPQPQTQPQTQTPPAWQRWLDQALDSFLTRVADVSLAIRDEHSGASLGLALRLLEIGRCEPWEGRRRRLLRLEDYELLLNARAGGSAHACHLVEPLSVHVGVFLPPLVQALAMQQTPGERVAELHVDFPPGRTLALALRPAQVATLLGLAQPVALYTDWQTQAAVADDVACVQLTPAQAEEYMALYRQQWTLEHATGALRRLYVRYREREAVQRRLARLAQLEADVLASRLLYLRSLALDWDVPAAGTPLPFVSDDALAQATLRRFLARPVESYVAEPPAVEPLVHRFRLAVRLPRTDLRVLDDAEQPLLTLFARDVRLDVGYRLGLARVAPSELAVELALAVARFGLQDARGAATNVFPQLLDRNPQAQDTLTLRVTQRGDGHSDVTLRLTYVSLLLVFDPLLSTARAFLSALEPSEAEQMRFVACERADPLRSPEQRDAARLVLEEELPPPYSPLLLGGLRLGCDVVLQGCELCLLGDATTRKSHVLALTADTTLRLVSSARLEALELELVDVALQPCTVALRGDAIELELGDVRSILELEGDGVDLALGYRLAVGDPAAAQAPTGDAAGAAGPAKSAAKLWRVARSAASRRHVVETTHPELEQAETRCLPQAKAERVKAGARRKLSMQMSDFAMNLSASDLGVLLSILAALTESMQEDADVVRRREARERRMAKVQREVAENRYKERLKAEFRLRDADGGGSLDVAEVEGLLRSATNCAKLTRDELDATVQDFVSIVDADGSGDISLDEFESALSRSKILYTRLHRGVVAVTGQEYVDPSMQRNKVPFLSGDSANNLANAAALAAFWERYEEQVGASPTSLGGQPPAAVQKKMVRTFRNYEYAQEAWLRLVNPSLVKPGEQSPWLLSKDMSMGSRGDVIDQLLSSLQEDAADEAAATPHAGPAAREQQLFVHTVVSTSFGGFYLRLVDNMLPMGLPALELSLEELGIYANFSVWEGGGAATHVQTRRRATNHFGVAKVSFDVYGNYYNTKGRQIEPFVEFYQGTLDVRKEPAAPLEVVYSSDRYFQLNVTSAFMEVVNSLLATFSKVEYRAERERLHIKEEGGVFWMLNESGVNLTYFMVAKKEKQARTHEEIVTPVSAVAPGDAHACILLHNEESEEYEQQSLKEKQLRQAFRDADEDGSGELDTEEVRTVLRRVYEEEDKQRGAPHSTGSSGSAGSGSFAWKRGSSSIQSEHEFDQAVDAFIALADTDESGQVSWEEFKVAISKSRAKVERYISVEVEGYQTIHNVPLASIGQTQVYELTPLFADVEAETSIAALYERGVALLTKVENASRQDLQKAYACLRRVKDLDPNYEWIDSYYADCARKYLPVLAAIHIAVDGFYGLQVKVSGAEYIRNGTAKDTELLMLDEDGNVAACNPSQRHGEEHFFVLPALDCISIPLALVDAGSFAIRQTGETDWSNYLPLSISEQRVYKKLTRFEQREAQKAQRGEGKSSVSSTKRVEEKMGKNVILPDLSAFVPAGKEIVYPSSSVIDDQPTVVVEKISANSAELGTWSLTIQPQLVLHNVLPCGVEYAIVQAGDCPAETLDSKGQFRVVDSSGKAKKSRSVKTLGQMDYFAHVNEVNCRNMYVESGKTIQVFGLDLTQPAMMRMRVCASETSRAATWSEPFVVRLEAERDVFNADVFELRFEDGPGFLFQPQWEMHAARTVFFYSPFWIQNRSGLDLRFKMPRGHVCSVEQHREYFGDVKEVPLMVTAPEDKALICIRPFQETPRKYEGESLVSGKTKKFLPTFHKLSWTDPEDMATVSKKGELRPHGAADYSYVFAFEVRAAPAQFFRSKIFVISPRFVFVNHVPRPLQMTPMLLDKKGGRSKNKLTNENTNCVLKEGEAVIVYRLLGPEKYVAGLRLRDMSNDVQPVGDWSPNLPLFKLESKLSDPNVAYNLSEETVVWTRGSLGDGPVCSVKVHEVSETVFATVSDISTNPNYRIENRSTRYSFRYVQYGVKDAEDIVLGPLESHSFAWEDPKGELRLRVMATHWKVPTVVDFLQIGEVKSIVPEDLHAEVYIDGSTRVFAMGDTKAFSDVRQRAVVSDWLSNTLIDVSMHGFGLTLVDEQPREILNITMENIQIDSKAGSRRFALIVHHVQLDDMTPNSAYPVVFAPVDSGFNSDKREGWLPQDGERPFFTLSIDTLPHSGGITIVNDFDLQLESMAVKVNLEYVLGLGNLLFQFIPGSDEATILQQGIEAKNSMLLLEIPFPDASVSAGMLFYFKRWRMSPYEFDLVFDSLQEDKGEGISAILGNTMGSIVGGIAHVTPEFQFGAIVYQNRFFYEYDLMYDVILKIVHSVIGQWYKIVGSVEMLGDPVGLATDIVDGFALAARQLKRDVKGKSRRKGESAITVVQTVFGVPLRSVGKVSNGLGDVVKKATYFQSQENPDEPRHVPEGVVQSGVLFGKSLAYGVTGFVKEPVRGAKSGGVKGFAKGVGRGTLQLVASPVVGTLGVVEKMSQSMSNTTHLMDEKYYEGTRRPARDLQKGALKQLTDSNVITEVEVHCLYIDGLPDNVNPKVVVRVYTQASGCPAREVGEYKTTTAHRTGTPKYDQSWLVGVTSLDTFVEVNVYHKRKPLPKKRLGFVRLSMEDIYRDFDAVPGKLLADTNAKMQLKRRKRVRGSIISKLASASEHPMEVRDDSWKQRISRPPKSNGSSILDEDEAAGFEDYDQELSALSSNSICMDGSYPPQPVGLALQDCDSDAKIFLSIRYVNDMRRYA